MILTLAVGSILGAVYVTGRVVGTPGEPHQPVAAPTSPGASRVATAPAADSGTIRQPSPPAPSPAASATSDREPDPVDDPARPPLEGSGPYGSRISTGSRDVALTFDDGPNPEYTPKVLAELERYQVKATFCLVGELAAAYPELVRSIAAAGHTLCNHSWSHDPTLGSRAKTVIRTDLTRTNAAIRAAVPDARIVYYRQPYGGWTAASVATAWELGMTSVHWDVDSLDYNRPGAGRIASIVTGRVGAGSIVLMHDAGGNRQQTVDALRTILPNLLRRFSVTSLPTGPPQVPSDG
ncbi:peptidoglycan/xylan/chitin deacetylase (PgdA/CDA1 family) [Micromonospora pisi]|uniref:Peptidoglycan/xylan/chitin deacetylase (PgdA/CDA1 family) n=1 Tax=Micromonospora pisi TaxID=589240 RepID=A0A495JSI1_9ACTN|nr:polysaccharide deacetylase family protein [Micromonospora pisi]RKR91960.1 peptidoglycan/xylan/chitin deacetylase (PgdA/CDA1 family) [Micromonospora pisi]